MKRVNALITLHVKAAFTRLPVGFLRAFLSVFLRLFQDFCNNVSYKRKGKPVQACVRAIYSRKEPANPVPRMSPPGTNPGVNKERDVFKGDI